MVHTLAENTSDSGHPRASPQLYEVGYSRRERTAAVAETAIAVSGSRKSSRSISVPSLPKRPYFKFFALQGPQLAHQDASSSRRSCLSRTLACSYTCVRWLVLRSSKEV